MFILYILFFLFFPFTTYPKERVTIYTQKAEILNKPIINCDALANYLSAQSSKFDFECVYIMPEEFLRYETLYFSLAIVNNILFSELKEKFSKSHNSGVYPLFNIFSGKFSHNGLMGSVFFTKANSDIKSLKDFKGKTIALVSECASCSLLALYELKKYGIEEKDLKIIYKGNWEKVIKAVLNGEVEVGAIRTGIFEYLKDQGKLNFSLFKVFNLKNYPNFSFLVSSELIPDFYFIYTRHSSPELLAEIYRILAPFVGKKQVIPASDLSLIPPYEPHKVMYIQRQLMIGPYAHLKKEIENEKRKALIIYSILSLIGLAITTYILYLYRIQNIYKRELEEATFILEEILQEKSTSLRLTSQKLSEEVKKLEKILASLEVGIALIDKRGAFIKVNKALEKIFHLKDTDLLGKPYTKIFEIAKAVSEQNILNTIKLTHTKFLTKVYLNGQEKFLLIAKTPIEGTPYSLLTVRDVTLEKKWEEEITHYTQLETLRVVASGLAHDLNNLLAAILNNVEILLVHFGYQLPSHPKEKLENIKKNCLRAKALTQQLLVYGKSLILSIEEYSLISWLKEIVDLTLAGSSIEVQYIIDPEIKTIYGDKNLLGIALQNILLNARQAMNDRGLIKIYVEKKLPYIEISIYDSGPGIPDEIKDKLFQPFTSTKPGGSGLGLFSTKRIIEAHEGKIEIESSVGNGTWVKIYLPYKEETKIEAEQKEKQISIPIYRKKILLMDDEQDLRESLKELLEMSGFEVMACERGEEVLELYQKEGPFDAVILDLTVPGKYDGIQTFLELKKIDPEVKAILATGYAYKRETFDAKSLGFFEVLIKPYSFDDIIKVLEKISR